MHTPICDELGVEFPIFAFTHCRDVGVAAEADKMKSLLAPLWQGIYVSAERCSVA